MPRVWKGVWTFLLMMAVPGLAGAGRVELVSGTSTAADSFGTSAQPALSADGRYVAFLSTAANLVPGQQDDNNARDVFLHDRLLGTTTLVSHAAGAPARAASLGVYDSLDISADGRWVAFSGAGADLVPGAVDTNGSADVFLWDRVTDTTTLVSHAAGSPGTAADGASVGVHLSADGNFVAFSSRAGNLVAGQAEPVPNAQTLDVFLWSRASGAATLVSRRDNTTATTANGSSMAAGLSADGGVLVFTTTAADLLQTVIDVNTQPDVYVYQRSTGTLSLISRAAAGARGATGASHEFAAVSDDGRYVAFASASDQLVPAEVDGGAANLDAFLYDRVTGEMRLASHASTSQRHDRGVFDASSVAMSADGRYVAFSSLATDLVPGQVDTNQAPDVFVYDRVTGLVSLASHGRDSVTTAGSLGGTGFSSPSGRPRLSADGRFVAFHSLAVDLVPGQTDTPGTLDVFLYDQTSRSVTLASRTRASASTAGNRRSFSPAISADGRVVAFLSEATDLGEGQADPYGFLDLFLYDRTSGEITSPSRPDPGLARPLTSLYPSTLGDFSADGRFVAFLNLSDVYLRDTAARTTTLVSPPLPSPDPRGISQDPALSADGRFTAFLSILAGALYLYDRETGAFLLVNHAPGSATQADGTPSSFALSADGRYVAYQCSECSLVPGHTAGIPPGSFTFQEIFLYDRLSGANTLVSRAAGSLTARPQDESYRPAISSDGRYVVFWSRATNLVPGQVDVFGTLDLFVFDRTTGGIELVTNVPGSPTTAAGLPSAASAVTPAALSADGRFIAFQSAMTNLVAGQVDTNQGPDVFLRDQVARTTALVSHAASSPLTAANRPSQPLGPEDPVSISADGRFLVYESPATDLVAGASDANGGHDAFLYDRLTGASSLVSHAAGAPLRAGNGESEVPRISADGRRIAFLSGATDLTPAPVAPLALPASRNLYVQDRSTGLSTFIGQALRLGRPVNPFPSSDEGSLSFAPQLSADGRRIAFTSDAALAAGDYNGTWDVYLWDQSGPVTVPACKVIDTRRRSDRPILSSNVQRTVTVRGRCGVPATAKQVMVKVTVFNPSGKGNLRFYPGAVTEPLAAILRFERGATRTESFTLPLSANGTLTILPFVAGKGTVHVAVEVNGYSE